MKAIRKVHDEELEKVRAAHQAAIEALLAKLSSLETDHASHRSVLMSKLGEAEGERQVMENQIRAASKVHASVGCDFTSSERQAEMDRASEERVARIAAEATVRRLENENRLLKQKIARDEKHKEEDTWMAKACPRCPGLEKALASSQRRVGDLEVEVSKWEENEKEKRKRASAILDMVHEQDSYIRDITQKKHYRAGAGGTTGVNV